MNIRDAIADGQKANKAIRRKLWTDSACLYNRTDNVFYWFCGDSVCDIPNHFHHRFSVAELMADDWELSSTVSYHGKGANTKIEIGQRYSSGCYESLAEIYDRSFVLFQDLDVGDVIVLTDVDLSKNCSCLCLTIPYEISGDYCLFDVTEVTEDGLVLEPCGNMEFHDTLDDSRKMPFLFKRSDYTIIMKLSYKEEYTTTTLNRLLASDLIDDKTRTVISGYLNRRGGRND